MVRPVVSHWRAMRSNAGRKGNQRGVLRCGVIAQAAGAATLYAWVGASVALADQPAFVQDGKAGFVVAHIEYALSKDADELGACPNGMTQGVRRDAPPYGGQSVRGSTAGAGGAAQGQMVRGEDGDGESARRQGVRSMSVEEMQLRFKPCLEPQAAGPDPGYRTVDAPDAKAHGIDLDGMHSRASAQATGGACPHDDLLGMNGERGIDNQFYRVVGCSKSFQSTGQSNTFEIEMHTGSWGILLTLEGLDDIRNDDHVEVGFFANADPIELSPTRGPLPNATYAADQDPRFRAKTRGRIVDGVLTTDPVDVRFHWVLNSMILERPLRDARVQMTLSKEGALEGYLAGYTPVEDMYDLQFGFRNGKDAAGKLAPLRLRGGSAMGAAAVLGHTCNGAYFALHANADGHPDPVTGKCTSISTQYRVKVISAFVVDAATASANEDLLPK